MRSEFELKELELEKMQMEERASEENAKEDASALENSRDALSKQNSAILCTRPPQPTIEMHDESREKKFVRHHLLAIDCTSK